MNPQFDTVDLGIIWSRLVSVADEMVSALVRTSFSTMVRESGDYSCMLFDARGRLLSQGTASVPSFTGTGPATVAGILEQIPAVTLEDGDIIITNDPWIGTGHVYDVNVLKPIFNGPDLVGYALSISHLADIGGIGYGTGARDVQEEGICIPPVKLFRRGEPNTFVLDLLRVNVRFQEMVIGDIYSNIAACNVAARAFNELLTEYAITDFVPVADGIFQLAHAAIEQSLSRLPRGSFPGTIIVDGAGGDSTIALEVVVDVSQSGFAFDFTGSPPVVGRGINVPLCYTRAYCSFCFKSIVSPTMPNNQALLEFVTVTAPENCILNALRPSPTGGRHILGHYIAPLVFGALAQAMPGAVQADSAMIFQMSFRGRAPSGRDFSSILFTAGGYGAFADRDGRSALPGPSNMIGIPVEVWEEGTGITVLRKELRPDGGGAGCRQGGAGQIVELRNDTGGPLDLNVFGSRLTIPARGFDGGQPGSLCSVTLDGAAVDSNARLEVPASSVIILREAGGGGVGSPGAREAAPIHADLKAGFITLDYVREHYPEQYRAMGD